MSFKRKTTRILVTALAALALFAAGCGDSDDESTPTTTTGSGETQSKADYIAAADAICTQTGAEVSAQVDEQFGSQPTTNEDLLQFFTDVTIPALQAQFEEIDALPPPEGEEEAAQAIADAGSEGIAEAEADPALLVVPQGAPTPLDEFSQLAQDFGLKVCGGAEPPAGRPSSS